MLKKLFRSKSHPYSRASKLFGQLRYLDDNGQQYWLNILDIIQLCMEAIRLDKFDGDAHVLLANAYLLGALGAITELKPEGYVTSMSKCAAVIYEWKTNPQLYSTENKQGEKIYIEVVKRLENPETVLIKAELPTDISKLHKDFYHKAIVYEKTG